MHTRLDRLTTLRVGGPAARIEVVGSEDELVDAVGPSWKTAEPALVLGGGSNVLISDEGWPGTVVLVRTAGVMRTEIDDDVMFTVAAGEPWAEFVATVVSDGFTGIECLAGIPGLVGASPIQNVGAYGQEVGHVIRRVRVYDRPYDRVRELTFAECEFGYRSSVFKRSPERFVVLTVVLALRRSARSRPIRYPELARTLGVEVGESAPTSAVHDAVLELRGSKGMLLDSADHDTWSAGSFFTNPVLTEERAAGFPPEAPRYPAQDGVKLSAAWLIEHAGFHKGYGNAVAGLSSKHTLALTNRGGARAADILDLARHVRDGVRREFGVTLVPEPVLVNCEL